jgi:abnormal spindle-like microcephaly-associated protein
MSMESIVSNVDFGEIELCAASSRLNLNEIGRSPARRESEVPIKLIETPPNEQKIAKKDLPTTLMAISPPRNKLADELREMYQRENFSPKHQPKQAKSPYVFVVPRIPRDIGLRAHPKQISQSLTSLSSSSTSLASTSSVPASSKKLYNENVFSEYTNFDIFSAATLVDPFLMGSMFLDERTLDGILNSLKKWLNALVTIPADLESKKDEKIDVAKLFNDVQNKELTLAPTKETVCSRYYTGKC